LRLFGFMTLSSSYPVVSCSISLGCDCVNRTVPRARGWSGRGVSLSRWQGNRLCPQDGYQEAACCVRKARTRDV